jgi:hypothetical protein
MVVASVTAVADVDVNDDIVVVVGVQDDTSKLRSYSPHVFPIDSTETTSP